jgi:hypothetical protein
MCLIECKDLAPDYEDVAKAGNRISKPVWLDDVDMLRGVIAVQSIVLR